MKRSKKLYARYLFTRANEWQLEFVARHVYENNKAYAKQDGKGLLTFHYFIITFIVNE
jgi:hypothetical protein